MNRTEMVDELLERLETELDELTTGQLASILEDYEHSSILATVIENLASEDDEDGEDGDDDEEELPLVDDEVWEEEPETDDE